MVFFAIFIAVLMLNPSQSSHSFRLIFKFVHSQVGASVGNPAYAAARFCIPPHPAHGTRIAFCASSPDASEKFQFAIITPGLLPGDPDRLSASTGTTCSL